MPTPEKTAGQVAYEAYCRSTNGRSAATGDPLPPWDRLNAVIRAAWRAAAEGVLSAREEFAMPPEARLTAAGQERSQRQQAEQDAFDRMNPPGC